MSSKDCRTCKHLKLNTSYPTCKIWQELDTKKCFDFKQYEPLNPEPPKPKPYNYLGIGALLFFLTYVVFSFVLNTPDASQWEEDERSLMIFMFLFVFGFELILEDMRRGKRK